MTTEKTDWAAHQVAFIQQHEASGITIKQYALANGLNPNSSRKYLRTTTSGLQPKRKLPRRGSDEYDKSLADLLNELKTSRATANFISLLQEAITQYRDGQAANIDFLARRCASFDGKIQPDEPGYTAPETDEHGNPKSPHREYTQALKEQMMLLGEAIKNLSLIESACHKMTATARKAVKEAQDSARVEREQLAQQLALKEAVDGFMAAENPWSAKKAAAHIEITGAPVPFTIRAQAEAELMLVLDEGGTPISDEALDEACVNAVIEQRKREKMIAERAALLLAEQEMEASAQHGDGDDAQFMGDRYDDDEIDLEASFDDDCVTVKG